MIPRSIIIILLFIGIIFITIGITKASINCKPQIIYRYVPRTFEEEQLEPVYASDIFKTMFSQHSPWVSSIRDIDNKKKTEMNNFFLNLEQNNY
jgi:hypothetical protein